MRVPSLLALALVLLVVSGCDCSGSTTPECTSSDQCAAGSMCVDTRCVAIPDGGPPMDAAPPDGGSSDAGGCSVGQRTCGSTCCAEGEVCGTDTQCCALDVLCGTVCCDSGQVCEGAICRLDCGTQTRCHDDAGAEVCCADGEVCASDRCFAADTPCQDFIDCPAGQYCEPTLGSCLPQPTGAECVSHPMGGAVVPTLLWHWDGTGAALPTYMQVMMAPMVANLNDDNGDGVADENDIPDVVFNSFAGGNYSNDGVLRAVRGTDGASVFDVTDPALRTTPGAQVAIGDLDGDGWNEIVTCASDSTDNQGPLIAFRHDGTLFWRATDPSAQCGQAAPAIADLNGDGTPEVFVRYTVLDGTTGELEWQHDCVGTGGWATSAHSPCDYTTAADLDGDGQLELVGGNVAYHADGTTLYDRSADFLDGYPAVGDLDLDGTPEVVVIQSAFHPSPYAGDHWLRALNADGTDRFGPIDLNAGHAPAADVTADTVGGGGPPTIANVDDDPEPEITSAGAYAYAVFDPDGSLLWSSLSDDRSSRKTGSSVFDFDGDGAAEVVYNDQYWLRVYDGRDGTVRFCQCNTSATLWEYPVIVDVDTDGHAEIVLASNDYGAGTASCQPSADLGTCETDRIAAGDNLGTHGIRVFASPSRDWVGTRRIWNQHTYHVTNVTERGAIPAHERPNWSVPALNDFRLNVQPGATNLPDLVPVDLAVSLTQCTSALELDFRVQNQGWSAVPAGAAVAVYVEDGGSFTLVTRLTTSRVLLPGEFETFSVPFDLTGRDPGADTRFRVVVNDDGDPSTPDVVECRTDNDQAEVTGACSILL